jgi:NAD(P)-dependent dehydrogenase (short-subunit alcohol dehydrogenase family)
MDPTCCLVTGGSGYLGQFVVRELCRAGYEVHFTYALHAQVAELKHAAEEGASGATRCRGHKVSLQDETQLNECLANIGRPVRLPV